jgi:hypothetical protein
VCENYQNTYCILVCYFRFQSSLSVLPFRSTCTFKLGTDIVGWKQLHLAPMSQLVTACHKHDILQPPHYALIAALRPQIIASSSINRRRESTLLRDDRPNVESKGARTIKPPLM